MTEQSIRDDLAEAMIGVKSADGMAWPIFGDFEDDRADTLVLADAILASPVIRRIQAEALRGFAKHVRGHWYPGTCQWVGALDDEATRIENADV